MRHPSGRRRRGGCARCPWAPYGRCARRSRGRGGRRGAGWRHRLRSAAHRTRSAASNKTEKTRRRVSSPMDADLGEDATVAGAEVLDARRCLLVATWDDPVPVLILPAAQSRRGAKLRGEPVSAALYHDLVGHLHRALPRFGWPFPPRLPERRRLGAPPSSRSIAAARNRLPAPDPLLHALPD